MQNMGLHGLLEYKERVNFCFYNTATAWRVVAGTWGAFLLYEGHLVVHKNSCTGPSPEDLTSP